MKRTMLSIGLASVAICAAETEVPTLKETVGIGAGVGAQIYNGTFGDNTTLFGRGFVKYNPLEWLGTRLTVGYGDISNGDPATGDKYETDWFSNAGLDLVLQPKLGNTAFRPYLASGLSTTFGTSAINDVINYDLDWNFYVPVELGAEYLLSENLSVWAFGETYLHAEEWDKLDGIQTAGDYFDNRDDLYKFGFGLTFRIGLKKDADKDRIVDGLDQCANTPMGVKVDLVGCPLDADKDKVPDYLDKCASTPVEASVDTIGCPVDGDKDGVADYLDKCAATPTGVRVDDRGCPVDADKDGIADYLDKCANTAAGVKVDAVGCPVPLDADKDGVVDALDKCPGTAPGTKVDGKGCTLDTDKDGVADSLDKCPGTKLGDKVDSTGCTMIVIEKGAKLVLDGIVFKTGSAQIDESSAPTLARAAVALSKAPDIQVEIAGFTDNKGKAASNKALSLKRAQSVKAYLVKLGASAKQLIATGYGAEQPVADNATEEGRAQNRRIEFRVK
jgi:outer membrane protein OmpA-like peptidoglycan-associated protein